MALSLTEVDPNTSDWRDQAAQCSDSLVLGSFTKDRQLRYANAGMRRLLKLDNLPFDTAFFRSPNFASFLDKPAGREPVYVGLLTIHDGQEVGNSIRAAVFHRDDGVHVIGEHDVSELAAINDQMHDLNREVSRLHRESARQTRELQKALRELQDSQSEAERLQYELVEASRRAGRAEVAVGVLHNIGNTLNGVSVSAGLVAETVRSGKLAALGEVVGLLENHRDDLPAFMASPQGGHLLPYLQNLATEMLDEKERLLNETSQMVERLDVLKQFVDEHQVYGNETTVNEQVDVTRLIKDAWPVIVRQQNGRAELECGDLQPCVVYTDPFRLVGLFQELMATAVSLATESAEPGRVLVTAWASPEPTLRIALIGLTLSEDEVQALVRQKSERTGTSNLHDAANTATELKAQLSVQANSRETSIIVRFTPFKVEPTPGLATCIEECHALAFTGRN